MKGQNLLFDFKMLQEFVGNPGVFRKNEWCFFEDAQRSERDVFEVADRSRDEDQSWHGLSKYRSHHFFDFGARDDFNLVFVPFDSFRIFGHNDFFVAEFFEFR